MVRKQIFGTNKNFLEKNLCKNFCSEKNRLSKRKCLVWKKSFSLKKSFWSKSFFLFSTVKPPNKNLNSTQIQRLTKLNTLDLSLVFVLFYFVSYPFCMLLKSQRSCQKFSYIPECVVPTTAMLSLMPSYFFSS